MAEPGERSGRPALSHARVARYTLWNVVGMSLPMVVALFAFPVLARRLGPDRLGLLGLVWMLVGYFCIFDMGLGRALTKMVAERLGGGRDDEVPTLFWTAMTVMLGIGLLGAALVAALSPWLVNSVLKIEPAFRAEALQSFRIVCFGLPVVITTVGLMGMLEAQHRFGLLNFVRVPMGTFTFLGPVCVLPFTNRLPVIVGLLIAGRVIEWLVYLVMCLAVTPGLTSGMRVRRALVRPMLGFGGWMTVSNILMPLMVHIDRFLVGGVLTVEAVAYYMTPAEVVVKLLIFPRALVSVLFPSFSAHLERDREATAKLFGSSGKALLLGMFPVVLAVVALAPEGLQLWLGGEFGARSAPVMRWLAAGILVYALAYIPYVLIQGAGRPDLTAKVHVVEFVCYLVLAPLLIRELGIAGAAIAWFVRVSVETLIMYALVTRFLPGRGRELRWLAAGAVIALGLLALAGLTPALWARLVVFGLGSAGFLLWGWRRLLSKEERRLLVGMLPWG